MQRLLQFAVMLAACAASPLLAEDRLHILIVDRQNNHNWKATTPVMQQFLEDSGKFIVAVATTPPKKSNPEDWDAFDPDFFEYDAVLSNYNGELWPAPVQRRLEAYVKQGGGLVIVHAANNAFPQWSDFNKMIGLGWRNNKFGDRVTVGDNGGQIRTPAGEGPGAGHGPQHEFAIRVRDSKHPVTAGMPSEWMHSKDELYHGQRGPGQSMHILATAYSAPDKRGTDAHEPMIWWIPYGDGKVFTTVMGHADYSMKCIGFQTTVLRGAEWVAVGEVTIPIPDNFPTSDKVSEAK